MKWNLTPFVLVVGFAVVVAAMSMTLIHNQMSDQWLYLPLVAVFVAAFLHPRWVYLTMLGALFIAAYQTNKGLGGDMAEVSRVLTVSSFVVVVCSEFLGYLGRERRNTLAALEAERRFLNGVQETTHDGMRVFSPDGALLWRNRIASRHLTGALAETPLRAPGQESDPLAEVVRTNKSRVFETVVEEGPAAGSTVWVRLFPMREENHQLYAVLENSLDITERKQAEEALAASEARYRDLVDCSPDIVWRLDTEGRIVFISPVVHAMMGYEVEEVLGRTLSFIVASESLEPAWEAFSEALQYADGARSQMLVLSFRRKDGRVFPVEVRYTSMVDEAGVVTEIQGTSRDVTERERIQRAVERSEEMNRALLNATTDMVLLIDRWGSILTANENLARAFNRSAAQLRNMELFPLMPARTAVAVRERLAMVADSKETACMEEELMGFRLAINIEPVMGASREVTRFALYMRDVTAQRATEDALNESERTFMRIFHASSDAAVLLDTAGRTVDCNAAALRLLGIESHEQVLGKRPSAFAPPRQPDGSDSLEMAANNLRIALREGSRQFDWVHLRRDGSTFQASVALTTLPFQGRRLVHCVFRDIDAERRAEEERMRLATAIEQAAESVLITDAAGVIRYVNPAFTQQTGYTAEEAIGCTPRMLRSDRHTEAFYRELWETITRGSTWQGRFVNRRKNGDLFYEDATISPVRGEAGEIVNYVALKRDVTNEVLLERQLRQGQKMQAIGTLAGGIAHDFNNLLSLVVGHAEVGLDRLPEDHPTLENLHSILKAAGRASDLVSQILTFSRQEDQEYAPVQIDLIVKEALKFLRAALPANIAIYSNMEANTGYVLADATRIHQVIMNLCTNAFYAMRECGGSLTVKLEVLQIEPPFYVDVGMLEAGEYVHLAVADTGAGIAPDILPRIFEPFYTTKAVGDGTGLGLAVVHGIVESMGGAVQVDSTVGAGTTIHVYFPRLGIVGAVSAAETYTPSGGCERVLVVDDDNDVAQVIAMNLQIRGYEVATCDNAQQALAYFTQGEQPFDLVVTDYLMPMTDGIQFAKALHEKHPRLPLVLISGYAGRAHEDPDLQDEIHQFVPKPIVTETLCRAIRDALDEAGPANAEISPPSP